MNAEEYFKQKRLAICQYEKDLKDLGYYAVVYGFDLAHYGDDNIKEYQDVKFVMKLCNQMEVQLLELAKRYEELNQAQGHKKVEIIEQVRNQSKIKTAISPLVLFGTSLFNDLKPEKKDDHKENI